MISQSIAESDYEGWVAYLEDPFDAAIFEHVEYSPNLAPLIDDSKELWYRAKSRNVMEWNELPQRKIKCVELYFGRENTHWSQPVWRCDKEIGSLVHWIQFKMRGIVLNTGGGLYSPDDWRSHIKSNITRGYARTPVYGYKMGYWNKKIGECELWEITRENVTHLGKVKDPTLPKPEGFGLNPNIIR